MGCRCNERKAMIMKAMSEAMRGDVRQVVSSASFVGRTLAQDARSGELRRAAAQQLAALKARRPR